MHVWVCTLCVYMCMYIYDVGHHVHIVHVCVRACVCVCVFVCVCVISPSLSTVSTTRDCSYSQGSISQGSCDLTEKLHTGGNTYISTLSYYIQ